MPDKKRRERYTARATKNHASEQFAEHHKEPWSANEIEMLDLWDGKDATLTELAEILGRTREAVRQMYHTVQRGERSATVQVTRTKRVTREVTEVTETVRRPAWMDDPDEGSEWYV